MNSINHPWGISEKFKTRYGQTWADMDFKVAKIYNYHFRNNPLDTVVGTLHVANKELKLTYKQLLSASKNVSETLKGVYFERVDKHTTINITVNNIPLYLKKHELARLSETLADSIGCIDKSYQLGLYL